MSFEQVGFVLLREIARWAAERRLDIVELLVLVILFLHFNWYPVLKASR